MSYKYEIVFTAQNYTVNGFAQMKTDAASLNMSLREVSNGADNASRSFKGFNQQLALGRYDYDFVPKQLKQTSMEANRMAMSLRGLIFGLQMTAFSLTMITSYMMSMESAMISIEGAQERYNEAIRENGRNSSEARSALRSLEQAQLNYQRSLTMSNIMTVSMGLQFVSLAISAYQSIPAIDKLIGTLRTYNVVAAISKAMNPWGWVALAGGIAIGAGAVYAINQMQSPAQTQKVNVNVGFDESLIAEFNRRFGGTQSRSLAVVP